MAESKEGLKSLFVRMKEENEKAGLNLIGKKNKIMACSPITSWQIDGEKVETVPDFIFLDAKVTVGDDYSLKIKRNLLLGWKATTNLYHL